MNLLFQTVILSLVTSFITYQLYMWRVCKRKIFPKPIGLAYGRQIRLDNFIFGNNGRDDVLTILVRCEDGSKKSYHAYSIDFDVLKDLMREGRR